MKLYTEEQVREALNAGFRLAMETDGGLNDYRELFINALTPIELPSDEEIEQEMTKWGLSDIGQRMGYRLGVKHFRNKLKGGNK